MQKGNKIATALKTLNFRKVFLYMQEHKVQEITYMRSTGTTHSTYLQISNNFYTTPTEIWEKRINDFLMEKHKLLYLINVSS